jgi:Peptidase S46
MLRIAALFLALATLAVADEGMWPYNQFPADTVKQKRDFDLPAGFLDNLRLASVKLSSGSAAGGSAAFVSPNGLLLTNQHLIAACLSTDTRKSGLYAATESAETKCESLQASVLLSIDDVTTQVKSATKDTLELRNAAIAKLEKDCPAGTHCVVVKLFSGGRYDRYHYKIYTDLRVVFAPETELAIFGRQRDALTYLRYGLDVAFLRAYENGKPAATPHFLKWSADPIKEGDLVFTSGNPESTSRLATAAQLAFYRDRGLSTAANRLRPRIQKLTAFSALSDQNLRDAEPVLNGFLNDYKFSAGRLIGLRDDRLVNRKTIFENKVRRAVEGDPKLGMSAGKVWDDVSNAYKTWTPFEREYQILEAAPAPGSTLFAAARALVRNEPVPAAAVNDQIETMMLAEYLDELNRLGDKDSPIKTILGGKTPQQAAEAMVKATTLKDPASRPKSVAAKTSDDPIIKMALLLEDPARRIRKKHDDLLGSLETSATEKIAQYRFKLFGAAEPPDATGTARVEYGVIQGYVDRAGVSTPAAASFGGLYYRTNNEGPYEIPQRWVDLKSSLDLSIPLDFVSTCDLGGGDPGSPVVNRAGELIGITFDGNLESLPDTYLYTDEQARAVHVAAQGIAQALDKVYKATALLSELGLSK